VTSTHACGRELVRLFEEDPDLLDHDRENRVRLERRVVVDVHSVAVGNWHPDPALQDEQLLGLLVLDGLLVHEEEVMGVRGLELLGSGDFFRIGAVDHSGSLSESSSWIALEPTRFAVLDREFQLAAASAPEVMVELTKRVLARSQDAMIRLALARKRALPARTHAVLWQLADRFGTRRNGTVEIPLRLSHRLIADLAGCERAALTRAVHALAAHGAVAHARGGPWVLHGGPPTLAGTV
jgi:CRP-like cAMP-binding protein